LDSKTPTLSVFFHNYYGNDHEWLSFFTRELTLPFHLFYNGVADSYYRLTQKAARLNTDEPAAGSKLIQLYTRESTNKGKDVGGKLLLMDAWLKLGIQSDYILLLHDKHSPYHSHSRHWKKDLFRIAENEHQQTIIDLFSNDPQTGIVASKNAIRNELDNEQKSNAYIDSSLIRSLKDKYNIQPPDLQFVAGTMFWVRASLFKEFFTQYPPLLIRSELEQGNVTDIDGPAIAHSWERLLCWIVTSKGSQIRGI
jgi:lipopolysaccharide biosynthesis protein